MLLYVVRYDLKGNNARTDLKKDHLNYLSSLYNEGKLIAAGVFTDKPGGYLIFRTNSSEGTINLVENDPYIIHNARSYQMDSWDTSPFPLRM